MARLEDRLTNIEMDVIDVESEAVTSATGEDVCVVFVRWWTDSTKGVGLNYTERHG